MTKTQIHWKVNDRGMLVGSRTHDGEMTGISVSEGTSTLYARRLDGSQVIIELTGVEDWSFEFRKGAIISEIYVWRLSLIPEDSWGMADSGWNALYGTSHSPSSVKDIISKIPDHYLIQFGCSYGGKGAFICLDIMIHEGQ